MSLIPDDLRRKVIAEIYQRADDLDWDGLSSADRSTWYVRWLDDPAIGGIIGTYMPRDQARLWIKDMPMKHYARARAGIGPYANLVASHLPGAGQLARLAFGPQWALIEGTVKDKPNRCTVSDGLSQAQMIWAPPRAFQTLIWAGLNAVIDGMPAPVLVVVTRQGERLTDGQIDRQQRMADRIGVEVRHLTVSATNRQAAAGER